MRTATSLSPTVRRILAIDPLAYITDPLVLVVLLHTCAPAELMQIARTATPKSRLYRAAVKALEMHLDPQYFERMVQKGGFSFVVMKLIDIVDGNADLGARIMPNLCVLACYAEFFGISQELAKKLIRTILHLRETYGFAITEISENGTTIIPADDVIPA